MTMTIHINGEPNTCETGTLLSDLVAQHADKDQSVAVAINNDFIPRTHYSQTVLNAGDAIDIVVPVGGG